MTPAVPPRRRIVGWRLLLLPALILGSVPAAAQSMICGTFKAEDTGTRVTLQSPSQGYRQIPEQPPEPFLLSRHDDTLTLADLDNGGVWSMTVHDDGRRLQDQFSTYRLQQAAACQPAAVVPATACRADIGNCLRDITFADNDRLRQWCREDVPAACKRLLANYRSEARDAQKPAAARDDDLDLAEPAVCKPDAGAYDPDACLEAAREALGQAVAKTLLGSLGIGAPVVLPPAQLDEISAMCRAQTIGTFCAKAAEALWEASRMIPARDALQRACTRGHDPRACQRAAPLAVLDAKALTPEAAVALPCGSYVAEQGLIAHLGFGDGGMIDSGLGGKLQARLVDGDIRVRHDQGEDFVFKPLANGNLIGMDSWNRFAYYQRTGAPQQCGATLVHRAAGRAAGLR